MQTTTVPVSVIFAATTPTSIPMWHTASAACSRTHNCASVLPVILATSGWPYEHLAQRGRRPLHRREASSSTRTPSTVEGGISAAT
jgi:hypothetical protein